MRATEHKKMSKPSGRSLSTSKRVCVIGIGISLILCKVAKVRDVLACYFVWCLNCDIIGLIVIHGIKSTFGDLSRLL